MPHPITRITWEGTRIGVGRDWVGGGSGDGGRSGWGRRKRKITFIRIRARYDTKGYVLHKIPLAPSLLDLLTNISGDILILSGELANSFIQTFISLVICYSQVAVSQIVLLSFSTTTPVPSPTYPCFLHFFSFFFLPLVYISFLSC